MLRTPSACAPSSSDSSAIRFRSRVVQWTRHSRSRSCWIPNATANAPIRTLAIAESETFTASTPAACSSRAASMVRSMRTLRGGSISTETTNCWAASSSASRVGGGAPSASSVARSASAAWAWDGAISVRGAEGPVVVRVSSAARIDAMCSGVVPQHPPTIRAPASTMRGVTCAKYAAPAA